VSGDRWKSKTGITRESLTALEEASPTQSSAPGTGHVSGFVAASPGRATFRFLDLWVLGNIHIDVTREHLISSDDHLLKRRHLTSSTWSVEDVR